jgi:hypothetical protein
LAVRRVLLELHHWQARMSTYTPKQVWCYAGRDKDGTVCAVTVDCGDERTRRNVMEFMSDGLNIERVPLQWARDNLFTHNVWKP